MTIFRQLVLLILLGFSINLAGALWLEFNNTRDYLVHQLESDLENTATSLGLTLAPHLEAGDRVLVESTLNAVFDAGYYREISVEMLDSGARIQVQQPVTIEGVPEWFTRLELIGAPVTETVVTHNWVQLAKLRIQGHPGFALRQLWQALQDLSTWIAVQILVVIAFVLFGLRLILKPLRQVREQAERLKERKFDALIPLPKTPELRSVVEAVNGLSTHLQSHFAEEAALHTRLSDQAFRDATTGLGNRAFFNRQLEAWMAESAAGILVMIELHGLDEINRKDGFVKRDELVKTAAQMITTCLGRSDAAVLSRISANEFAVILDGYSAEQARTAFETLASRLDSPAFADGFYEYPIYTIGACQIERSLPNSEALALVDHALHRARSESDHFYLAQGSAQAPRQLTRSHIKEMVEEAIAASALRFSRQPVYLFTDGEAPLHWEVFARLQLAQADTLSAAHFISVLEEYELGADFDRRALELIFDYLHKQAQSQMLAINLSASAIDNPEFVGWLVQRLKTDKVVARQLCFEFCEESAVHQLDNLTTLCEGFKAAGVTFGVDRVGRHFSSLAYLQALHPAYVKIDHAFTRMALNGTNDAYFVGSLCTTIHNLDIKVIATRVENSEQLEALRAYHFDGYQGYVHQPRPFEVGAATGSIQAE